MCVLILCGGFRDGAKVGLVGSNPGNDEKSLLGGICTCVKVTSDPPGRFGVDCVFKTLLLFFQLVSK